MISRLPIKTKLQAALRRLKEDKALHSVEVDGFQIIRSSVEEKEGDLKENFYLFEESKEGGVGEGASSRVYKAYCVIEDGEILCQHVGKLLGSKKPLDEKKGEIPKEFVVKIFKDRSKYNKQEFDIQNRYYRSEGPITYKGTVALVSEYLPGEELVTDLMIDNGRPNPRLKTVTFQQLLKAAVELLRTFHLMHHTTPTTGKPVAHLDIKGANIKIHFGENGVDCNIFDFGLSHEFKDTTQTVYFTGPRGNAAHRAPEMQDPRSHQGSLKNDIYGLVGVFASLFGATDPWKNKRRNWLELASYNYDGMFQQRDISPEVSSVITCIFLFLHRMEAPRAEDRPEMDEVFNFFFNLEKLNSLSADDAFQKNHITAKIVLMSQGLWNKEIGTREIVTLSDSKRIASSEEGNVEVKVGKTKISRAFKDIDFEHKDNANLCTRLVSYRHTILLPEDALALLPKKPARWKPVLVGLGVIVGVLAIATGVGALLGVPLLAAIGTTVAGIGIGVGGLSLIGGVAYKRHYSQALKEYEAANPASPKIASMLSPKKPTKTPWWKYALAAGGIIVGVLAVATGVGALIGIPLLAAIGTTALAGACTAGGGGLLLIGGATYIGKTKLSYSRALKKYEADKPVKKPTKIPGWKYALAAVGIIVGTLAVATGVGALVGVPLLAAIGTTALACTGGGGLLLIGGATYIGSAKRSYSRALKKI